jgi:hypothetical protein
VRRKPWTSAGAVAVTLFALLSLLHDVVYSYRPAHDALVYLARAREFASGSFLRPESNWNLAPGYSLFLAPFFLSGLHTPWPVLVAAQAAVLGTSLLFLLRALERAGVLTHSGVQVVIFVAALDPELWSLAGELYSEVLAAALLAISLALALRTGLSRRTEALLLGGACAALVVTRFEYVVLLPGLLLLVLVGRRAALLRAVALTVAPAVVLGANAYRNAVMFGVATPFSFGGGTVLYAGVNAAGTASWHSNQCAPDTYRRYVPAPFQASFAASCLDVTEGRQSSHVRMDSLYRAMARYQWGHHTWEALSYIPDRLAKLWLVPGAFDIYTGDAEFHVGLRLGGYFDRRLWPWYGPIKHAAYFAVYWVTLALIVGGGVTLLRRKVPGSLVWLQLSGGTVLLLSAAYGVAFYGLPRFHFPALVILMPWIGGVALWKTPPGAGGWRSHAMGPWQVRYRTSKCLSRPPHTSTGCAG